MLVHMQDIRRLCAVGRVSGQRETSTSTRFEARAVGFKDREDEGGCRAQSWTGGPDGCCIPGFVLKSFAVSVSGRRGPRVLQQHPHTPCGWVLCFGIAACWPRSDFMDCRCACVDRLGLRRGTALSPAAPRRLCKPTQGPVKVLTPSHLVAFLLAVLTSEAMGREPELQRFPEMNRQPCALVLSCSSQPPPGEGRSGRRTTSNPSSALPPQGRSRTPRRAKSWRRH